MFPETWVWCDKPFFFIRSTCIETCVGVLYANISLSPDMCARVLCMSKETCVCKKRSVKETCKKDPLTISRQGKNFPSPAMGRVEDKCSLTHCNALQRTATHCNTLQHTATHCSTLQHTATHRNTPQHTATQRVKDTCLCVLRISKEIYVCQKRPTKETYKTRLTCRHTGSVKEVSCRVECVRGSVCCRVLQGVAVGCSGLQRVAVRCSALQCVAVRCSAVQGVAVRCNVLQCVAVPCSVLQCVAQVS